MDIKKVGVTRGGKNHYDVSLREGSELISHIFSLLSHKWKPVDMFIDKEGIWHAGGVPIKTEDISEKVDLLWDTTRESKHLEKINIPVVNVSGGLSSFSENGRRMLKEHLAEIGLKTLRHVVIPVYQPDFDGPLDKYAMRKATEIFEKFSPPWQMRLFPGDRRKGTRLAKTFPDLVNALIEGSKYNKSILVEEYVGGGNAEVHSLFGFRGKDIYVFPPTGTRKEEREKAEVMARNLHQYIPAAYYMSTGFVFHPKRGIFLSELEFSPDLSEDSHFVNACKSVGAKAHHVIDHILQRGQ